jgi:hypothetical protein
MSQTSDFRQIRGKVFFRKSTRELVFQVDKTFLTASALRELVVRKSKALGSFDVPPDALDQNVLMKLWSIATIADVRKSTLLCRSAKNEIEKTFAKAKRHSHTRVVSTQGLKKALVPSDNPHPFGHPALQRRCIVFYVFQNGRVECFSELVPLGRSKEQLQQQQQQHWINVWHSMQPDDRTLANMHKLRTADADRRAKACSVCRKRAKLRCECCGLRFCGVACQRTRHKG